MARNVRLTSTDFDVPTSGRLRRRGAVALVCAMTAAVVFLGISGVAVRTSLRARQERKTERDLQQLEFLCDAGILRAKEQLKLNPEYKGETWLDQEALYGNGHWRITIVVGPQSESEDSSLEKSVQVTAQIDERLYSPSSVTSSRTITLP